MEALYLTTLEYGQLSWLSFHRRGIRIIELKSISQKIVHTMELLQTIATTTNLPYITEINIIKSIMINDYQ